MNLKKVGTLAVVELKKLYRDPMTLAVLLLMPVGLTLVFYLALRNVPTWNIPGMSHFEFLLPGTMGYAVIYMGMMVAMALCSYREAGLLKRLQTTPTSSSEYLGSLIVAYMIIAVFQAFVVLLVARLLGYEPLGGAIGLLVAAVFLALLAVTSVGLGLLTATVAKNSGAASGLTMIFVVPDDVVRHFPAQW